jgi:hypothetical protein
MDYYQEYTLISPTTTTTLVKLSLISNMSRERNSISDDEE